MNFECSEEEFEVFESLFAEMPMDAQVLSLELTVLGVKPAAMLLDYGFQDFEQKLEKAGLNWEIKEGPSQDLPKRYIVSRSRDRLEMMDGDLEGDNYEKKVGEFLGYPEDDVRWFVEEKEDLPEELLEVDNFIWITTFAIYVPKPEQENIERARKRAERNVEALRKADERFNSDVGKRIIRQLPEVAKKKFDR